MISVPTVLERIGEFELVSILGGRIHDEINSDAFCALVTESDTNGFSADELAVAQAASDRVQNSIDSATLLINGYVVKRHPQGLTAADIADSPLPDIALAFVKYELMVNTDDDTKANHKNAMARLRDIASGMLSLGITDPAKPSESQITTGQSCSQFDWGGFGL